MLIQKLVPMNLLPRNRTHSSALESGAEPGGSRDSESVDQTFAGVFTDGAGLLVASLSAIIWPVAPFVSAECCNRLHRPQVKASSAYTTGGRAVGR